MHAAAPATAAVPSLSTAAAVAIALAALVPSAWARFGQQNPPALFLVKDALETAVGNGAGGTFSGAIPGTLLGGADPCAKLELGDRMIAAAPGNAAVLNAVRAFVHSESNFNPFATPAGPVFCTNPALPATPGLRGILSLVSDEGVKPFGSAGGLTADQINTIANASVVSPLANTAGKSVAQLYKELGFIDFINVGSVAGNAGAGSNAGSNAGKTSTKTTAAAATATTTTTTTSASNPTATASPAGSTIKVLDAATIKKLQDLLAQFGALLA
ncbi:hypothetical protein HK105_209290 [Polyrhizophydium stewartii]|uniref:Uncharacterized protein n=1 Tax=Polyrhizophydium stewartii TaxID=2732419 RepID=A0ABR4MVL9_9FUNG